MNKTLIAIIVVVVIVAAAAGAYFLYGQQTYSPSVSTQPETQQQQTSRTPTDNMISIKNFAFSPGSITVPVGTTVTWTNNDSMAHTVTSTTNAFNSGNLNAGGTFKFTFSKAGTYNYSCSIHPSMHGIIIVQ